MATVRIHIGIDVSKENLDVFVPGGKEKTLRVANTLREARKMVRRAMAGEPDAMFCCEATGGYEDTLLEACRLEGAPACRMNARQARCYAMHLGVLEKSDGIDARMISLAADDKMPEPLVHPTARQKELRELWTTRTRLVVQRDSLRGQLEHLRGKDSVRAVSAAVKTLEREIARLEALCRGLVDGDAADRALAGRYTLVKGVGTLTALAMVALMPELLTFDDKALAKLAGLAPLCDQSGARDGQRHIGAGRGAVRRALYWAAVTASTHNAILSAVYRRMVDAGKPKKVAIVAVMRKLLCLLRRIAQDPCFVPASA